MQTTITSELIITNSYLAEINFTANAAAGQRIYFKDIPTLSPRDGRTSIQTVGLEAYCDADLSFSPSGAPLISAANMATLLVTLAVGSREVVYLIPANSLRSIIQSGVIRRFYNLPINIVKSYVQVVNAGINAGESICFNFYYREVKK
jgi:hypothetical protein